MIAPAPFTCSILLVDDETLAEDFMRHGLHGCADMQLSYLADASRACAVAQEVDATVVVVDLRMPALDGFEVTRQLRANPATGHVPVVLLSSEDDPEVKARAFAAGANDYLVKWPDARELRARLRYHSGACLARRQRDAAFNALRQSQIDLARSQAALHQAQKMEAIGQLTGGVAHDFNNVLQIIGGNLQLVKLVGGINEAARSRIDTALSGVERGARLAAHLLAFARRQPLQSVVIDPGAALHDMQGMLRHLLGPHIAVEAQVAPALWRVAVDPSQLHNVLVNLCLNARDAMADGGRLTLRAANVPAGAAEGGGAELGARDCVLLAVCDTGAGMAPEVLARAFEPFFTTKPTGQGTGLGLSMAHGFVKQSGGEIELRSAPGQGTTVRIFLPRSADAAMQPDEPVPSARASGVETILVVEDEADVRSTTVALLSARGYRVLEAGDAGAAAELIESGAAIDLLFSDVIMPGRMSACELGELVKRKLPRAQILFTSGYAEGVLAHGGKLDPSVSLLQKPYDADVLAARIGKLLRSEPSTTAATEACGVVAR